MPAPRLVQGQSLPAKSILMLHGPSANTRLLPIPGNFTLSLRCALNVGSHLKRFPLGKLLLLSVGASAQTPAPLGRLPVSMTGPAPPFPLASSAAVTQSPGMSSLTHTSLLHPCIAVTMLPGEGLAHGAYRMNE